MPSGRCFWSSAVHVAEKYRPVTSCAVVRANSPCRSTDTSTTTARSKAPFFTDNERLNHMRVGIDNFGTDEFETHRRENVDGDPLGCPRSVRHRRQRCWAGPRRARDDVDSPSIATVPWVSSTVGFAHVSRPPVPPPIGWTPNGLYLFYTYVYS